MQKKQKFAVGLLLMLLCLVFPSMGQAAPDTSLYLNGNSLALPENISMLNNSVMVPIRVVSEELGYKVDWNQKAKTVAINDNSRSLNLTVNQKTATVDNKDVTLVAPPIIKSDIALVPLRFIGENMGLKVDWDNSTKSVYMFTSEEVVTPPTTNPGNDSSSDNGSNTGGSGEEQVKPDSNHAVVTDFSFDNNQLHIALDHNVRPSITTMDSPDRVVIDLPNAVFSDQFYEKYSFKQDGQGEYVVSDYPDVQRIRFAMFSDKPNTVRFVIDASYPLNGNVTLNDQGLTTIALSQADGNNGNNNGGTTKPPVTPNKPNGTYTVVIDAGHGGKDSGAISLTKKTEKDFTLALALKVGELLRKEEKINLVMTREDDSFPELSDRSSLANKIGADIFVSIHGNSAKNSPSVTGTETFYYHKSSEALAKTLHKNLLNGTQFKDRGIKFGDLHVVRETKMPSALLEIGFLTSTNDEPQMFDEQFQWRVAENIVKGIKEYLGVS
ncbi:N-acetylmuramoyl-L-alanine amidase [Paenibacillus sp. B1-33]|uniref:N-acetylmuramoyl-L-alanine amidase n=1 Tax=unclassified Paenibacillus TaxID=185978 RepID=UPI003D2E8007